MNWKKSGGGTERPLLKGNIYYLFVYANVHAAKVRNQPDEPDYEAIAVKSPAGFWATFADYNG